MTIIICFPFSMIHVVIQKKKGKYIIFLKGVINMDTVISVVFFVCFGLCTLFWLTVSAVSMVKNAREETKKEQLKITEASTGMYNNNNRKTERPRH